LGEALVAGYNAIQLQTLSKSELRAKTEADVKLIAEQRKQKVLCFRVIDPLGSRLRTRFPGRSTPREH